jgi:hypothetical protein
MGRSRQALPSVDVSGREAAAEGGGPAREDRAWPFEMRPKDAPPRQIVAPSADIIKDPAFALRREEFEQHLVRRNEANERKFAERTAELEKTFEAKVKARVEARFVREDAHDRVFTEAQFMDTWRCLHPDSRKTASDKALARAFRLLQAARKRLVFAEDKAKAKAEAKAKAATPEPPEGEPPGGALS